MTGCRVCVRDSQGTRVQICSEQGMVIIPGSSYEKMEDGRLRYPGPGYADYCPEVGIHRTQASRAADRSPQDQHCDDEYISTVGGVCRPGKF